MGKRDFRPLNRPVESLETKRRFVIFCEGRNTEPQYFRGLEKAFPSALVKLKIVEASGAPITIARRAAALAAAQFELAERATRRDSFEEADQIWAVFDRDVHEPYDEAIRLCREAGVHIGRCHPCFELWLLLHMEEYGQQLDHTQIQKYLQKRCPEYDRHGAKTMDFKKLVKEVATAEIRGERQLEERIKENAEFGRPSTTVWQLTRAIRNSTGKV